MFTGLVLSGLTVFIPTSSESTVQDSLGLCTAIGLKRTTKVADSGVPLSFYHSEVIEDDCSGSEKTSGLSLVKLITNSLIWTTIVTGLYMLKSYFYKRKQLS